MTVIEILNKELVGKTITLHQYDSTFPDGTVHSTSYYANAVDHGSGVISKGTFTTVINKIIAKETLLGDMIFETNLGPIAIEFEETLNIKT